ncbi:PSP1-domain-containing protein [Myriangium duriaei CBS 260.36]|uniref:PSP1-domain-containing protein n=1 Tax=Myriangium duriaei CBS 260.36 TaxID=1168546 RepID=A0A9P4IYX3_9PEZI|nr:PSP1-domain-containing protein [Myriangium duriaei CBS 260.36]
MHATAPAPSKAPNPSRPGGATGSANPSLAETARLSSLRRSTPDSEAILSSDDEHELSRSIQSLTGKANKASEGSSWLSDIQSGPPRRASTTTSASNMSQPTTPYDQINDANGMFFQNPLGRVASNPVNASWNSAGPWTQNPSRLFADDRQSFVTAREGRDTSPSFSVPVQPIPKTHRSQSYSVGQTDSEAFLPNTGQNPTWDKQRTAPSQQLPHRPSRPSMLSEVLEGSNPAFASERYDRESYGMRGTTSPDGRRDNLVESSNNQLLRHATKARARHGQSASTSDARSPSSYHSSFLSMPSPSSVEQVIDEEPDSDQYNTGALSRRFSELAGLGGPPTFDGSRRGQWQSSLGFGLLPDIPQSRRHSMADMPTRRNSLVGATSEPPAETPTAKDSTSLLHLNESYHSATLQDDHQRDLQNRNYAVSYFSGIGPALRSRIESSQSPMSASGSHAMPYHHQGSAHGIFSRPSQDTPLYLVSFKCARAEVYYVADNTGLEVKEGDLVIVEADRGHDLGTVLNVKLSWTQARELKVKANDEHYRWLMMFSRHNQSSEGVSSGGTGGMMAGNAPERSPTGTMQAPGGFNAGMVDSVHRDAELKPKMIKRLAQPHEIATLRDKEGNEAKAKRICQQKVNEMKLDMEILDAEFQTDWKKLTFFYYANSYVNFNALVTDLFKVYKTRIWMSAVNPASLNTAPVPPPRGLGPGAVSGRDNTMSPRGGATRGFAGSAGFSPDHYGAGGLSVYQNTNQGLPYEYNADQTTAGHGQTGGTPHQGYDMLQYASQQSPFNPSMHNYAWGNLAQQPAVAGFGGNLGMGYGLNQGNYGSGGQGHRNPRGTPGQDRNEFNDTGRTQASVSPISPPATHGGYRKQ